MKNISIKFFVSFVVVLFFRLVKGFGLPGFEPVMGTTVPFAKQGGVLAGFIFAAFSIAVFDVFTGTVGAGTIINSLTYGIIGAAAGKWFQNRELTRSQSAGFAVVGTLFYDLITGVIAIPLLYPMSFEQAFLGQIPFTAYHLIGNIAFAVILSPLLYKYIITNPKFSWGRDVAHA